MKLRIIQRRFFILFTVMLFTSCMPRAAPPPSADVEFAAMADEGHTFLFHVDGQGKVSRTPIDFLKGESSFNWDVVSLDQLVIADMVGREGDYAYDIKYYKNKILTTTSRLTDVSVVSWMLLLLEKNCLIVDIGTSKGKERLVRIDLSTGEQKVVELTKTSIDCKPIWDKTSGKLIVIETGGYVPSPGPLFDSLAHLDPDNLTITDVVKLSGVEIDGLLYADASGQHVTAYGVLGGGQPHMQEGSGTPGFIEFDMATGKPTMIMKDTSGGDFWYLHSGIAAIDHRYVIMAKVPSPPIDLGGYRSYCVDLQEKKIVQLSGVAAFAYPNSHDGLLLASPPSSAPSVATPSQTVENKALPAKP